VNPWIHLLGLSGVTLFLDGVFLPRVIPRGGKVSRDRIFYPRIFAAIREKLIRRDIKKMSCFMSRTFLDLDCFFFFLLVHPFDGGVDQAAPG
jgi:hypothetical protein